MSVSYLIAYFCFLIANNMFLLINYSVLIDESVCDLYAISAKIVKMNAYKANGGNFSLSSGFTGSCLRLSMPCRSKFLTDMGTFD